MVVYGRSDPPAADSGLCNTEPAAPTDAASASGTLAVGAGLLLGERYEIGRVLGSGGVGRVFEAFDRVLGERVAVRPVPVIEDARWTWHVGLDAEATGIANALWRGERVPQERLARILWLGG